MTFDSRVIKPRGVRPVARQFGVVLNVEPVYCVSCHHQGGEVTFGMGHKGGNVIYLCGADNGCGCNCEGRFGTPAEMMTPVPDPDTFKRM